MYILLVSGTGIEPVTRGFSTLIIDSFIIVKLHRILTPRWVKFRCNLTTLLLFKKS